MSIATFEIQPRFDSISSSACLSTLRVLV
jgi:hypothetical protein